MLIIVKSEGFSIVKIPHKIALIKMAPYLPVSSSPFALINWFFCKICGSKAYLSGIKKAFCAPKITRTKYKIKELFKYKPRLISKAVIIWVKTKVLITWALLYFSVFIRV